jgi:Flp pilus assembly pilin Flp
MASTAKGGRGLPGLLGHLARLHEDERGVEGIELILIIAAISLPLLGLLIIFRKQVKEWVQDVWKRVTDLNKEDEGDYFPAG